MLLTSMMEIDWASIGIDHVFTATSGVEAVQLLEKHAIDIVITDIRMPGMDGLEVCEYVREHCPRTKCIILSGYSDFNYAQQAIKSKAVNYLIKPVKDAELIAAVTQTLHTIAEEWEAVSSMESARQTLRQNLPLLRSNLLNELITGTSYSDHTIEEKLSAYALPFSLGDPLFMVMIRMEKWYKDSNEDELSLYEFSVGNIINELMQEYFELWSCKDSLGYLIWLVKPKRLENGSDLLLDKLVKQVQTCVNNYLLGEVSVLLSFQEPLYKNELFSVYRLLLNQFRKLPRSDHGFFIRLEEGKLQRQVESLQQLYQPPTLLQLLEAGRFEHARGKIQSVFKEIQTKKLDDEEHILEVTTNFYNAFSYVAHLQGLSISDLIGDEGAKIDFPFFKGTTSLSVFDWFLSMTDRLEKLIVQESSDVQVNLVHKVHQYIEENISVDISLQAIGEHVHLHPAYLSGIYKQLTGENISDYIYRHRMEKSGYLLLNSDMRVYELAQMLGFQNAPYFSKLFKTHYGITPQEYRDKFRLGR
jgi:two-component system, response regulator YesN